VNRPDEWADYLDPSVPWSPGLGEAPSPEEQAALDRITAYLADEAVWSEPPAQLRSTLLARAAAEAGPGPRTGNATESQRSPESSVPLQAPPASPRPRRVLRNRRPWYLAVTAAAASAALVVVLAWPHPQVTTFAMAGTSPAGTASATADLEERSAGVAITLHVKGLKAAPAGAYYAAWMRGRSGTVPVGTFHWHKGGIPIDLWSGVTPDRYPELFVTLQREGEPVTPSSEIVLRGRAGG
jgi:Anti-sigma-K factor rskA